MTSAHLPLKTEPLRILTQGLTHYHGWPTLATVGDELWAVCSGFRAQHVCPFGKVVLFRSTDGGDNWDIPEVLHDSTIDDRDAGILFTARGTVIVTWFTSMAWLDYLRAFRENGNLERHNPNNPETWEVKERLATHEVVKRELGVRALRSEDKGHTWSEPMNCIVNSPHGPTQLTDGSILFVGRDISRSERCLAVISKDDGTTWEILGEIPSRVGDDPREYHEFHAVQAQDGRVIAQIRNHNPVNGGESLQCESFDQGATWTTPHSIGVWGCPSHLLKLSDGRLLMTYSYRRDAGAILARVSQNCGDTWSDPFAITEQTPTLDMGYPSSVELPDGRLCTLWYQEVASGAYAELVCRCWRF